MDEELKVSLANLGDVTGCTIVVNCPEIISVSQVNRLRHGLSEALPEAAHILVLCAGIEVSVDRDSDTKVESGEPGWMTAEDYDNIDWHGRIRQLKGRNPFMRKEQQCNSVDRDSDDEGEDANENTKGDEPT